MDAATRDRSVQPDRQRQDRHPPDRRRFRLFAGPADEPRARRVTDALVVAGALLGLLALGLVAVPPAGFERALIVLAASIPNGLDGLWLLLVDLLAAGSVALAIASAVRRRWALLRDLVLAAVLAIAIAALLGRVVDGDWPALWSSLRAGGPPAWFPPLRLTLPAAVLLTGLPHLSRSARRQGTWIVLLAALSTTVLGVSTPSGTVAGLLVATIAAAVVHLAFGSVRGRPTLDDVRAALTNLAIDVDELGAADRQPTGLFLVDAMDSAGEPLVVKLYGRDAHDTQLLTSLWRTVWYRDAGAPVSFGRLRQAQHEALLTLLARQAGIVTQPVVTAGATVDDDVVLVLRPVGQPLASTATPTPWDDAVLAKVWAMLARLHGAGIAHGQVDDSHLIADDGELGLLDFRGAAVAPPVERLRTDRAQAVVTTALGGGEDRALAAAAHALGHDELAAVLPFLQATALTARQRSQVRAADLDLDDLRDRAADLAGVEPPELQRLRRVKWSSILQLALLIFAFFALATGLGGLDLGALREALGDATWGFIVTGFFLAQAPRLTQSIATLGASPLAVGLGPLYGLQLAASYINLAVPSTAARVAVNVRFFQRHGLPPGSALAVGAIDGFATFLIQIVLLLTVLLLTPASLEIDLDSSVASGLVRLVLLVVGAGVVALVVVLVVPRWRRFVLGWVRRLATEAFAAVRGLRSPRRLGLLLGGSLATELLFALALGTFARAFGYAIGLDELVLINVSVALLAGLLPVPGGIGVVEGGLTFGLVRAGLPEETAFAAALLYRMATFYLPPIWGFFALKWLERNKHL